MWHHKGAEITCIASFKIGVTCLNIPEHFHSEHVHPLLLITLGLLASSIRAIGIKLVKQILVSLKINKYESVPPSQRTSPEIPQVQVGLARRNFR